MTPKTNAFRRFARSGARALAYSAPSRNLARKVIEDPSAHRVRDYIEKKGHGHKLRRLASQQLPDGTFFAKLTIKNWSKHRDVSFRLLQGDQIVYGNKIEPPARGFDLEYRNIIVTSDNPKDFSLDIGAEYGLLIGRGAFTTAQQQRYDERHGVEQHGDLFYSLRGNIKNPKRALVTFPGFGPPTSRVSYIVNDLKGITDEDLEDTVAVCFQDRYLVSGSYMLADNAGSPLRPRVHDEISRLLTRYGIAEKDLMLFGASKGGSIATIYAEGFPSARLLTAAPQMSLPYYLDKPFFRENLYRLDAIRSEPQPGTLMRQYFTEGRRIDYFYTDRDEQSNHSLVEFIADVPGLTKYRVDGEHADVAKKALPTILTLLKRFARGDGGGSAPAALYCDQAIPFPDERGMGFQLRLANTSKIPADDKTNVLLDGHLGRTEFRQLLSDHQLPFIKYTAPNERLREDLHATAEMSSVLVTTSAGEWRSDDFPPLPVLPTPPSGAAWAALWNELDVTPSSDPREYSLLASHERPVSTFQYEVNEKNPQGTHVRVVLSDPHRPAQAATSPGDWGEPRSVLTASSREEPVGIAQFAHRVAIAAGVDALHVIIEDPRVPDIELDAVHTLYGPEVRCDDHRDTNNDIMTAADSTA